MSVPVPLIGIPACRKALEGHFFHGVAEKYIVAVMEGARGLPVVIPAAGTRVASAALLERLDGLLLPGSPSNVEPHHYGVRRASPVPCTIPIATPPRCR